MRSIAIREFSHSSTQGFYLVAGQDRVATATKVRGTWRLVWTATQAEPITGPDALAVVSQAIDVWSSLVNRLDESPETKSWNVPAEVGVSRSAVPMGGQPGYRRR